MERKQALELIREHVKNENLIRHMIATEAIMKALARHFGEDENSWGMAGLLHDIDVELTDGDMEQHSRMAERMLRDLGLSDTITHAVLVHNETHGIECESLMDKALFCADPLTGLITAAALVRPEKQLANVEAKSIRKRFKEKSFAAGANRDQIAKCSEIGLDLYEFFEIGLDAMKGVASDFGL